jgi:hypothetical protein
VRGDIEKVVDFGELWGRKLQEVEVKEIKRKGFALENLSLG